MTSLIAWTGVDSRGPASIYLACDSRITWEGDGKWDFGRKVFASYRYPDILGYCGEVLFTSQVLGQIISIIDSESLFLNNTAPDLKFQIISSMLKEAHVTYPQELKRAFSIIHCSRSGSGMSSLFEINELSWDQINKWQNRSISMPLKSDIIAIYGTGTKTILESFQRWKQSEVGGTSRSVFSAFCDSVASDSDPATGGATQLVGIFRQGNAKLFGTIYKQHRYLHGLCVDKSSFLENVEWFNELFERCNWATMNRLDDAQPQPRPNDI
jgi:hypothetical protein